MKPFLLFSAAVACAFAASAHATVTESLNTGAPTRVDNAPRSIGQAEMLGEKSLVIEKFASRASASHRIQVSALSAKEMNAKLKSANVAKNPMQRAPQVVGIGVDVDVAQQAVPFAQLNWETLANGARAARIEIAATGAAGMRVGYRATGPVGKLSVKAGNVSGQNVYAAAPLVSGERAWSPTIESDRGVLEFVIAPGASPADFTLNVEKVSQLGKVGRDLANEKARNQNTCSQSPDDIGCSESCNVDFSCVANPSQALLDIGRATAKYIYIDDSDGRAKICTGTLLNSNTSPRRPYFFTATHCVASEREAASIESYWFFDSVACNSLSIPPYQRMSTGASLRLADENMDVTLVELNSPPPTGAIFAAWEASIIPRNAIVVGVHHPSGDLKAFSEGTAQTYVKASALDSFLNVRWTPGKGTTEPGSSGSGIFTFNSNCGGGVSCYQLRGGLLGGSASCANPAGLDFYSRMDLLFTKLAPYLSPSSQIPATTSAQASMVEFYNPEFDYYFMTSRESEKSLLDSIKSSGGDNRWYRTGYWFKTDPFASPTTSSITRYAIPGAAKNQTRFTHFYTVLQGDRQAITNTGKERFSNVGCSDVPNTFFCNEGTDSYVAAPIGTGATAGCAAGERPIWRVFRGNQRFPDDANHRYVNSSGMYSYMVNELGWDAEFVNMCAKP